MQSQLNLAKTEGHSQWEDSLIKPRHIRKIMNRRRMGSKGQQFKVHSSILDPRRNVLGLV